METIKVEYPQSKIIRDLLHSIVRRANRGLVVYGHPIDEDPMTTIQALREALEEATDAAVYLGKACMNTDEYDQELMQRVAKLQTVAIDLAISIQTEIHQIEQAGKVFDGTNPY